MQRCGMDGFEKKFVYIFMLGVSDGMKKVYIIKSSVNKLCDGIKDTTAAAATE